MSRPKRPAFSLIIFLAAAFAFFPSCAGAPDPVETEWTAEMFFKNAQEAMDESRYKTALYYYEVFMVRYPDNHQRVIAAEYERAFIHYKTGDLKSAEAEYKEILRKYDESPYAMLYPVRFRNLCEIGLENIEKQKTVRRRLMWRRKEKEWAEAHGENLLDSGDTAE